MQVKEAICIEVEFVRFMTMNVYAELESSRLTSDNFHAVQEVLHGRLWTDGLPVIPPEPQLVSACLEFAMLSPSHLVGIEPVRERAVTAEKLAVNAVMAGCLPAYFPLVVTAITAMLEPEFCLHGATSSTGGCGILVAINGPARLDNLMDGTFNALGGGGRAAITIGRALRLILYNIFDVRPGEVDRSTLGHPGKISYCLAEDEEGTNWLPLATERGMPQNASSVTVMAAGAPRQIMNEWTSNPAEILDTYVAEIKSSMLHYSIWPGNYAVLVPPQLRKHFESAGWTKEKVRDYVFQHARVHRSDWESCGKSAVIGSDRNREHRALGSAEDLLVISAGGAAGGFGAVVPPWLGSTSRAVTLAVGACVDCEI